MSVTQDSPASRSVQCRSRRRSFRAVPPRSLAAVAVAICAGTGTARAEEAPAAAPAGPPPPNYVIAVAGTTVMHRPSGGSLDGWQHDITPSVGFGRFVTDTIALELDIGPTYVRGSYAGLSLVPGVVWAFSSHIYAAARFVIPVDPQLDLGLYPGAGLIHTFDNNISIVAEADLFSDVGRGNPDFGIATAVGALYSF
jgi:hypothetical protein